MTSPSLSSQPNSADEGRLVETHPLSRTLKVVSQPGHVITIVSQGQLVMSLLPGDDRHQPWLPGAIQRAVTNARRDPDQLTEEHR